MKVFDKDKLVDVSQAIPWDFHCVCRHVAASHWYATGRGELVSGRCNECPLEFDFDKCGMFRPDNLVHLEMKSKERV